MDSMIHKTLLVFLILLPPAFQVQANSLLIWPIYPKIVADANATSLWMVNHGKDDMYLQVRVFSWDQQGGQDNYQPQNQLIATPPFVKIAPGAKQLIRVLNQDNTLPAQEYAYRVIIDELPPVRPPQEADSGAAVKVRMRYSIPLFMYGEGISPRDPSEVVNEHWEGLQARIIKEQGEAHIQIENSDNQHVRLVNLEVTSPNQPPLFTSQGLSGYVLAGRYKTWPIAHTKASPLTVAAEIEGKRYIIPLKK